MRPAFVALAIALLAVAGCQTTRPPEDIVKSIGVVNQQVDVYVTESNWALEAAQHADRELLIGTGERLRKAVAALNQWVQSQK